MKFGIYSGTFDPPTLGHLDLIVRSLPLFETLHIVIGHNHTKRALLSLEERVSLLEQVTSQYASSIRVVPFSGLLVDYGKKVGASVFIRGIRNGTDFEYETQMAAANQAISGIETIFLAASPQYSRISSTLIREIIRYGGKLDPFLPQEVINFLNK